MRHLITIIFLIAISSPAGAQSYNFLHFTVEDGLSNSTILDICEDKFGHLWFATQGGGLNKYDGHTFERITIKDGLASNFVRSVLCDSKGNIWAATASGISRYNGSEITNYLHKEQEVYSVSKIHEDKEGRIWFSHPSGGVGFIVNDSIHIFNQSNGFVDDVVIDINANEDGVWVLTNIKGLYRFNESSFSHIISNAKFKGWLLSIEIKPDGKFLLGSNKGILMFDPKDQDNLDSLVPALKNFFVRSITIDAKENIWVALSNGAIELSENDIKTFSEEQGFTSFSVNTIYKDREGTLWFGTEGDGIYKFGGELFYKLGKEEGLSGASVTSIVKDINDNIWIGTYGGGLNIFNGDSISSINTNLLVSYITSSCKDKDGNLWFGTRDGIVKYDYEDFYHYNTAQGLINDGVRCIAADSEGNIWIGTVNGLSKFDGNIFYNYSEENGLSENNIWQLITGSDNTIYVVTRNGIERIKDGEIQTVTRDEKIFGKRLNAILFDDQGNLWVGYSGHGIARVDNRNQQITPITTNEGLSSDFIYNMTWDMNGNLVVGTERGVDKIVLDDDRTPVFIKNYGAVEGFKGLKTAANAVYKEEDGDIWFGSDNGLYKYQPEYSNINNTAPLTHITNLKLFYNDISWKEHGYNVSTWNNLPENLVLSHNENHIIFQFSGISLKNPSEVKYQFMLENLEEKWSPPTSKTEAAYTNLPPGSYTFKVRAANSDGIWSAHSTTFSFAINAPFWQQWWFYLALLVLIVASLKMYNDYRVRLKVNKLLMLEKVRADEQHNVRKKMARDFHDNMGNQLASITVYVNLISMKLQNSTPEISGLLTNIEKHTKSLFTGTKDFIWSMDPQSDEMHELFTYIKDFGEELFQNTSKQFYSYISSEMPERINLPSGYSRQIVLIFKEAMTNALKHSNGDKIYFTLKIEEGHFVFSLKDNGTMAVTEEKSRSKGLKNMASRAEQINGELNLTFNGGVEVALKINV